MRAFLLLALLCAGGLAHAGAPGGDAIVLGLRFRAEELAHPLTAIDARIKTVAARARDPIDWGNFTGGAPAELYEAATLAARLTPDDRARLAVSAAAAKGDPERMLFGLIDAEPAAWDRFLDSVVGKNFPLFHKELIWAFAPVLDAAPAALRTHLIARLPTLYAQAVEICKTYGDVTKAPKRFLDALARILVAPDKIFARARARGLHVRQAYAEALGKMQHATLLPEVRRVTVADVLYLTSILPAEIGANAAPIVFGSFVNGQADPRRSDIDVADPADVRNKLPRTGAAMKARFGPGNWALALDDEGKLLYEMAISGVYNTFYIALEHGRASLCVTSFSGFALSHDEKPVFTTTRHPL